MVGFLLALAIVVGVVAVSAGFYRYAAARSDEIMEVLEPDEPEDSGDLEEPDVPWS